MNNEQTVSYDGQPTSAPTPPTGSARPRATIGLYGLIGIVLAMASTWGFLILADEVPEHGWMVRVDLAVTAWLQSRSTEGAEAVCVFISLFGGAILAGGAVGLMGLFAWKRRWHRMWLFAAAAGGGQLLNVLLKTLFRRIRPEVAAEFHPVSWSFPSGHAMMSIIVYGLVAHWAARDFPEYRLPIWTIASAIIGAIGFSRVYLGVHYISDVAAGYSAGFVWLIACAIAGRVATR